MNIYKKRDVAYKKIIINFNLVKEEIAFAFLVRFFFYKNYKRFL